MGIQIGGMQTTTAIVGQGQQQAFGVHGNFGGGSHTVSVGFPNDQLGWHEPHQSRQRKEWHRLVDEPSDREHGRLRVVSPRLIGTPGRFTAARPFRA
jgi:hypothetical protein